MTGKPLDAMPEITPQMQRQASQEKEMNRQAKLKESMDTETPQTLQTAQPPNSFELMLQGIDWPAKKVREQLANAVNRKMGTKLDSETVSQYIGHTTAPGDPVGAFVNKLITDVMVDPLNAMPVVGIPTSAWKAVGKAGAKVAEKVAQGSKALGVDLAA